MTDRLEEKVDALEAQLRDVCDNHIATLTKVVSALDRKLAVTTDRVKWLLVLNIGIAIAVVAEVILGRV